MKKLIFFLNGIITIVIISLIAGCSRKSIHTSVLQPDIDNSRKLPSFEFIIDNESLIKAYMPNTEIYASEYNNDNSFLPYEVVHYQRDVKMNDLEILLERYMNDIMYNSSGKTYGTIVWKPIYYDYKGFTPVYEGLVFLTCGLANFLGMPSRGLKTILELKAEIYNSDNILIGEYYGIGIYRCVYGFYGTNKDQRSLNIKAAKLAIESINSQIFNDYDALQARLLSQK
jgi:hypothetical protein